MRAEIPSGRDPSPKDLEDLADALGALRADQRAEALAAAREAVAAGLDADRRAKAMGALVALAGALAEFDKGLERREVTAVRMARSEAKVALAALADSAEVLEALAGRVQALWNAWGEEGHGEPARQTPRTTTACYTDGCGSGWRRRKSERALSAFCPSGDLPHPCGLSSPKRGTALRVRGTEGRNGAIRRRNRRTSRRIP